MNDDAMDYVVSDDEKGGYLATKHLLELGHRDILFLNAHHSISSSRERLAGYKRALSETGVAAKPELIREVSHLAGGVKNEMSDVIKSKLPYTALFAFNDMMAWEAIYVLNKHQIRVPDQISVVGFDNIQSRLFVPFPLTSVSNAKGKTSRRAFEILLKKMHKQNAGKRYNEIVDTRLVVRESTRSLL
ncbi:substrate-binding domain-containing protein [Cohnella ginsengisoli]|uniref:Substrate-binding domain-containing protein n=1 Tax=Cohnella ginsengisoli TaxID=425004 RepID=A0A9X4KDK6_9BACL|nr:substrate-binding domain-containing protein [Cohnella ginsengisoli]MDG0789925.1 substrate-binding domain-containing protein [Cohnella ginsengisoli]